MARPATAAVRLLTGEREPVRLATTASLDTVIVDDIAWIEGLKSIDGVRTAIGERVLVKDQDDARLNGIYTASEGRWYRAADARTSRTMQKGTTVHVAEGSTNAGKTFVFSTLDPVIGTSVIGISFYISDSAINDAQAASTTAGSSASAAAGSASDAATSATNAETSATNANNSATAASNSASAASNSATNAGNSATAASGSASSAATSANNAGTSATAASGAASASSTSATNAANSEAIAAGYASDAVSQGNVPIYSTRSGVPGLTIPVGISAFRTNGYAAVGDGGNALYKRVVSEPTHAGKVQSADGAWWEMVRGPSVDIRSFGAKADWNGTTGTDNQQAFTDAIRFLGANGGRVYVSGQYYKSGTHVLETNVIFHGDGNSGLNAKPSVIVVPAGKTAFIYQSGAAGSLFPNSRSSGGGFSDVEIKAAGKNATSTTGSINLASRTLTLASVADFETGQVVVVRGAGLSHAFADQEYATATTEAGSNLMTTWKPASASGAAAATRVGLVPGMTIDVAGAGFPVGTYVVSATSDGVCTMSRPAANTVANGAITYWDDLRAVVNAGGGTTTLTLNDVAGTAVTNAVVEHYDCAVVALTRLVTRNGLSIDGFGGTGIFILGGSSAFNSWGVAANANCSSIAYASIIGCRNSIVLKGSDANACEIHGVMASSSTHYNYIDASFLGSTFTACHSSGAADFMVVALNACTAILGCYVESGLCTLAERTLGVGGNFTSLDVSKWGGSCIVSHNTSGLSVSGLTVGRTYGSTRYTVSVARSTYALSINGSRLGGSSVFAFKRSLAGDGQAGLWGWWPNSTQRSVGLYVSDIDHPAGAGQAYLINGWNMGRSVSSLVTTNFRKRVGTQGAPTSGTVERGDWFEDFNVAAGGNMFHVCTTAGVIGSTAVIKTGGAIAA
ncbi:hypothetical protein [Mesorhizobium sp.]|uniref:hypothetical protein n=1 Tax=Mesorhizobium sp. TaxID=1871066 RepID=UPI0025E21CB5|nr:hypothetical protein [Mesorhizobium sp.]